MNYMYKLYFLELIFYDLFKNMYLDVFYEVLQKIYLT